jgi:hypothetical protein
MSRKSPGAVGLARSSRRRLPDARPLEPQVFRQLSRGRKRQRWLLLASGTPVVRPSIVQIYLLVRGRAVVRDDYRHPAALCQAKQPLIPARVSVTPSFALPTNLGEAGQEFIGERSSIVVIRVLPIKVVVRTGSIARAQAARLLVAEAGIAKIGTMIAIKERVRTNPTAPRVPAGRHERHHPELLLPKSVKLTDHGKDTNGAADVRLGVLWHDSHPIQKLCTRLSSVSIRSGQLPGL